MNPVKFIKTFLLGCISLCFLAVPAFSQTSNLYKVQGNTKLKDGVSMKYRLFVPPSYDPAKRYPLVLILHGGGELGTDNSKQVSSSPMGLTFISDEVQQKWAPFVLAPQSPDFKHQFARDGVAGPAGDGAVALIDSLAKVYSIDITRLYVTGYSYGGVGTLGIIASYPDKFAAAVPCASNAKGPSGSVDFIDGGLLAKTAFWAFHGDADGIVNIASIRKMIASAEEKGAKIFRFYSDRNMANPTGMSVDSLKKVVDSGANYLISEVKGGDHGAGCEEGYRCPQMIPWLFSKAKVNGKIVKAQSFGSSASKLPKSTYEVGQFGAIGDGKTVNTQSIQAAIDKCSVDGGGTVLVAGGSFVTGTIYIKSNVCLRVESGAVLLGSTNIADYTTDTDRTMYRGEPYMDRCLIFAKDAQNISIEGHGTIDGQGKSFPAKDDTQRNRPKLIRLLGCSNIHIHDITLQSPASWTTEIRYCSNIAVDGITIFSRANSNGDGLDFDGCTNVRVSNSTFNTSDDSICLQTSLVEKPCCDVVISNCNFTSRWAGIRIGLLSRGDFENILVTSCTFRDHNDSGLKIQMNEGAEMKNMIFSNLVMKNVPRPVFLTFCQQRAWVDAPKELAPMKSVSNIHFSNILVDSDTGEKGASFIVSGMPGHPVEGITFSDIRAIFPGGGIAEDSKNVLAEFTPENLNGHWPEYSVLRATVPAYGLYARHVKGITLRNVDFGTKAHDERPAIVFVDVTKSKITDSPAPERR